jgi:hypothetical protein
MRLHVGINQLKKLKKGLKNSYTNEKIIILPTTLFNNQFGMIKDMEKQLAIRKNMRYTAEAIIKFRDCLNLKKLSMVVKVKNSQYAIHYKYDPNKKELTLEKLFGMHPTTSGNLK